MENPEDKIASITESVVNNTNDICTSCKLSMDQISNAELKCFKNPNSFTYRAVVSGSNPTCEEIVDKIEVWATKEDAEVSLPDGTLPLAQSNCPVNMYQDCDTQSSSSGSDKGGATAGTVVAVIVVVISIVVVVLGVVAFVLYRRRRRSKLTFDDNFR